MRPCLNRRAIKLHWENASFTEKTHGTDKIGRNSLSLHIIYVAGYILAK